MPIEPEYYIRRLTNGSYNVSKFEGREAPSAVYNLTKHRSGYWVCSCPAYTRDGGKNCKHGRMVQEFIDAGEPIPNAFKEAS